MLERACFFHYEDWIPPDFRPAIVILCVSITSPVPTRGGYSVCFLKRFCFSWKKRERRGKGMEQLHVNRIPLRLFLIETRPTRLWSSFSRKLLHNGIYLIIRIFKVFTKYLFTIFYETYIWFFLLLFNRCWSTWDNFLVWKYHREIMDNSLR